jgi:hypothetical protein
LLSALFHKPLGKPQELPEMEKYIPLNFELMKNPLNWVIMFLMVVIAGIGAGYIASHVNTGG